ncbi:MULTISPECIES: type II toxin-antitoxin system YhaV family toxin [Rhodopseudomonas]|uniref:type II toxin-antitoxin system YhaV family toxin n=1 Tax=Rhodopseudomonas TaxID=1073 RepID=UPI0005C958A5|nr:MULTISPECIES: type II toxin-antitoxin system YhaV family toxin [Rhodopseudomonas]MDF3811071.1 type II toxin-antitoxin system YhaV family toxin [Rhodopseudomonas sp. BAL398]WOK15542.1 type II toxin-antitoxin system YhaV family toxin [Rhodopseudomonas sp. BAL398]
MIVNGWTIYCHPLFLDQLARLIAGVERDRQKDPADYTRRSNIKLLNAIRAIMLERIPQDPTDKRYRLGGTLGENRKHWFRDKFGNGRFRLFFRFDLRAKIIVYVWVNDETTLRTYGAKSDAYAVFASMLKDGNPPDSWDRLLQASRDPEVLKRTAEIMNKPGEDSM